MHSAVSVTNQNSALRVVPGVSALTKTISSTTITASSDSALGGAADAKTTVFLCQVLVDQVYVSLHGATTPGASNSLLLDAGTLFLLSRSEFLASTWKRVTTDATLNVMQLADI